MGFDREAQDGEIGRASRFTVARDLDRARGIAEPCGRRGKRHRECKGKQRESAIVVSWIIPGTPTRIVWSWELR